MPSLQHRSRKSTVAAARETYLAQRISGAPDREHGSEGDDGHARVRDRRVSRARCGVG